MRSLAEFWISVRDAAGRGSPTLLRDTGGACRSGTAQRAGAVVRVPGLKLHTLMR